MPSKNTIKFVAAFYFAAVFLASCKKNMSIPAAYANSTSFLAVFDNFWNGMNSNYVYWDADTTNWDRVYNQYKPLFAKLNLQNSGDVKKSVGYFRQITNGLIDSHYSINFINSALVDSFLFPALSRKEQSGSLHSSFLYISVDSNYLDTGFVSGKYISKANRQITAVCGTIKNKILYFNCSEFALNEACTSATNNGVKITLKYFFNQLQNMPPNIKALIIDVRSNDGGNLEDLNFFVGQLIDRPLKFGYTHYKTSNGRLDYTPWIDAVVTPQPNAKEIQVPIIVMADNFSISMAEAVTMAIKAIPNNIFVGETTWGATGPITNNVLYNDGQFDVPGFLSVYTSSAAFKYIDGNSYEGKGFPPDIYVPFNLTNLFAGKDAQLEKAINLVK